MKTSEKIISFIGLSILFSIASVSLGTMFYPGMSIGAGIFIGILFTTCVYIGSSNDGELD